ncbi:hypothetical protein IPV09_11105 [Tessaracoccus sp. SD287]|uniref:hypothetical protein n=1 Tax=Tessaracoccus sp. SD287 TaxID=2782008 RepID=UPI001A95C01B|nr:hypothetical protein [Tessaracoccus sp. SD287]MBO1031882.1 hypothetical protein [Tessaracoccus sp. SD287]
MKITWKSTNYGQIGFHAELHEYDAVPPVDAMLVDKAPATTNLEREAIAAYLTWGHWVSGDLHLPHRLGPNTAAAIEADMSEVAVRPSPIEYYPKPLEVGLREVRVGFDETFIGRDPSIAVLPVSEWTGSMRGLQSVAVASNAFTLDFIASKSYPSIRARLAVAVLFAGDVSADVLAVHCPARLPSSEKDRLTKLLLAARLGVRFVEPETE